MAGNGVYGVQHENSWFGRWLLDVMNPVSWLYPENQNHLIAYYYISCILCMEVRKTLCLRGVI